MRSCVAEEAHAVGEAEPPGRAPAPRSARARRPPSAAPRPPRARTRSKMRTTSSTRFTGRKFETWSSTFSPGGAKARAVAVRALERGYGREVDEVRDHLDRLADLELVHGHAAAGTRTPRSRRPSARSRSCVISKNERSWPTSVMSVPCSVVTMRGAPSAEHLLGEEARDRVRDRVVDVEEVERVLARRLRHLRRQREVVRRVLEERVGRDVDLVEADVLAGSRRAGTAAGRR